MIGTAQIQYEIDEVDKLQKVKELQREGHTLQCAAAMAWTGAECSCTPGDYLANRKEG